MIGSVEFWIGIGGIIVTVIGASFHVGARIGKLEIQVSAMWRHLFGGE